MRRALPWLAMGLLVGTALVVAAAGERAPNTTEARVERIAEEVRCPTCEGLSVAESDATASRAIRDEIRRRVEAGESAGEIRAYLVSRFGKDILLKPESSGAGAVVWALPVAASITAVGGLVIALRRLRRPVLWGGAVGACAVAAGLFVAGSAGERLPGDPASGSITQTGPSADLARARALIGQGKAADAIKVYDDVIAADPGNAEALAYRGWLVRLVGKRTNDPALIDKGLAFVERAVAADPRYPDARFFKGMILFEDKQDPAGAVPEFRAFLGSNPPTEMVPMVEGVLKQALEATRR
ncbi:MAG TPA: cytochrome c-type biogenesis protein CcmH [Acidimicrobiales bacterium]|nr:cytochrome c-type biogenesis protein CcmH [Acidimicrobiales bacterium]